MIVKMESKKKTEKKTGFAKRFISSISEIRGPDALQAWRVLFVKKLLLIAVIFGFVVPVRLQWDSRE